MISDATKVINYNTQTGEITHMTDLRFERWNEQKGYRFLFNNQKVKHFPGIMLPRDLSFKEIGMLHVLSNNMFSNTNMLAVRTRHGIEPMDMGTLFELLGVKKRQGFNLINKFIGLGIIAKAQIIIEGEVSTQYYMNPIYFFKGTWLSANLYFIFKDYLDEFVPDDIKDRFVQHGANLIMREE